MGNSFAPSALARPTAVAGDLSAGQDAGQAFSSFVKCWFALDAIVALAPPLYWAADGKTAPILGVPTALFYFLAVNLCITCSIVYAYVEQRRRGGASS